MVLPSVQVASMVLTVRTCTGTWKATKTQTSRGFVEPGGWKIAGDGCGNSYVLAAKGGFDLLEPIFFQQALFHRSEHKATFIAASNMLAFVAGLLLREMEVFHWPFDREKTLQLDPEIGIARGIQFPWDA